MYVVWKHRPLSAHQRCEVCGQGGPGRSALVPHLVASRREGGAPRQVHVARLPSVRSCCLKSERARKAWWARVDEALDGLRRARAVTDGQAADVRRKLQERVSGAHAAGGRTQGPRGRAPGAGPGCPRHLAHPLHVLRLAWPCRPEEAKAAFSARAKETHPDVGGRAEDFRAVAEAYDAVSRSLGRLR